MTPDEVMARAMSELQLKTEAARTILGFGETGSNWSVDLESGLFTYTRANGIVATAPVQIIGTLNTRAGTFLWGWDHPSVPEKCRSDAQRVREWGKTNGRPEMTRRLIPCDEGAAWAFTALAAYLSSAQGGYRGPAGATLVFMTFGEVLLSKSK